MNPTDVAFEQIIPLPPMPLMQGQGQMFFNPLLFGLEFIYALIIAGMFLFIFYKTRKMFELSKHKGVEYFRVAFLFFAFAYISRFLFFVVRLIVFNTSVHVPGRTLAFLSLITVTYFSTLGIGYLLYSSQWKKMSHATFFSLVNVFALITILIFYLQYPLIYFMLMQILLMVALLLVNVKKNMRFVYPLISLFWIFNLIIFHTRNLLGFEVKLLLQVLSIFLLAYFIYRILKWTR